MEYEKGPATALLRRTPAILRATLEDLPPEWSDAPERDGAWSAREVACHMADLERDAWLPRVRAILEHPGRPLPEIDRERFRRTFAGVSLESVIEDFAASRSRNLAELERLDLDAGQLETEGVHRRLGRVRVRQLLSTWVVHDLTHLAQISRALAAQYRTAVGPWHEFLSVLRPGATPG